MRRKLFASRNAARDAIAAGEIDVGGVPARKPATLVDETMSLRIRGPARRFVSRGGLKLEAALSAFAIDVKDRRAIDVGASTGGFTDCLLAAGAAGVVAVDVGYGQLDWTLRNDSRVTVIERTNFRHADPAALGAPFGVVVADLSFISLRTVAGQLAAVGAEGSDYLLLVKPQFEVGRQDVGKGGLVKDAGLHARAIAGVIEALAGHGVGARGAVASPVTGRKGNREFLIWARPGPVSIESREIAEVTQQWS